MRKLVKTVLATAALSLVVVAPTPGHARSVKRTIPIAQTASQHDWSDVVDFGNSGLNRYDPADAALLQVLSPERVKNPAMREELQAQLKGVANAQRAVYEKARQGKYVGYYGKKATREQAVRTALYVTGQDHTYVMPAMQSTMDPGCQLTSSNPGGYDLCGYWYEGDKMSAWASGRSQWMWSGMQERDTGPNSPDEWRVWWKSQAYGLSSNNVSHDVDVAELQKWLYNGENNSTTMLGWVDPAQENDCAPCYGTGASWNVHSRSWLYYMYGSWHIRDYAHINATNDTTGTDNNLASYWWWREGDAVRCDGPHSGDNPGCP